MHVSNLVELIAPTLDSEMDLTQGVSEKGNAKDFLLHLFMEGGEEALEDFDPNLFQEEGEEILEKLKSLKEELIQNGLQNQASPFREDLTEGMDEKEVSEKLSALEEMIRSVRGRLIEQKTQGEEASVHTQDQLVQQLRAQGLEVGDKAEGMSKARPDSSELLAQQGRELMSQRSARAGASRMELANAEDEDVDLRLFFEQKGKGKQQEALAARESKVELPKSSLKQLGDKLWAHNQVDLSLGSQSNSPLRGQVFQMQDGSVVRGPQVRNQVFSDMQVLVRQVMQTQEGGSMSLQLRPANLGRVDVDIRVDAKSVQLHMEVEKQATQQMLKGQMAELRQQLQTAGLKVDDIQISGSRPTAETSAHKEQSSSEQSSHDAEEEAAFDESENREHEEQPSQDFDETEFAEDEEREEVV